MGTVNDQSDGKEINIPDTELTACQQISEQLNEKFESAMQDNDAVIATVIDLLLEMGIIDPKVFEKRYIRTMHEMDQETAEQRDEWVAEMRERCPTLSAQLDKEFDGNWGPEHVGFD